MSIKYKVLLLAGLLCLLQAGCSEQPDHMLRVGANNWPGYQPLYLADELGYYDKESIRLIEYPSASEVLRAFRNKTLEAASLTMDEVFQLYSSNIAVSVVLIHDISNGADAIIARPGLNSFGQLKGKTIGVESSALGALVITRALELNGMDQDDVKINHVDFNLHENYFIKNKVDAVVTFDPVRTRLIAKGGVQVFDSAMIPGEIVDVLVIHDDYLEAHPENVAHAVKGWFKALNYMASNRDDAYSRIATRLKITNRELGESYSQLILPDKELNRKMISGPSPELLSTAKLLNRILLSNELMTGDIIDHVKFDDQFVAGDN